MVTCVLVVICAIKQPRRVTTPIAAASTSSSCFTTRSSPQAHIFASDLTRNGTIQLAKRLPEAKTATLCNRRYKPAYQTHRFHIEIKSGDCERLQNHSELYSTFAVTTVEPVVSRALQLHPWVTTPIYSCSYLEYKIDVMLSHSAQYLDGLTK